jgi:hypothetical protein
MQRIGVVQIGKTPGNIRDYTQWFAETCPYSPNFKPNNNLIVWWGYNGEREYLYYTEKPVDEK